MKTLFVIIAAALTLVQSVCAKDNINVLKKTIPLQSEKRLEVKISYGAGLLFIHPGKAKDLFRCNLKFTENEPSIDYTVNNRTGILEISTPNFNQKDDENKNYNLKNLDDLKRNTWHLYFSPDVDIDFIIENGASKNEFEFGSLRISNLELNTGASETVFDFSEPNPIEMERLNISSGVSDIKGRGLLNANFRKFRFEGGVGDYDFYFTGKLQNSPRIDIEIGVATTRLVVNPDTPFKVRLNSSFLSSIKIEDAEEVDDDYWISDGFDDPENYLRISADVGVGSFKVHVDDH